MLPPTFTFVSRGMVADIAVHNKVASDGQKKPHAHVMPTIRPIEGDGFGKKSCHGLGAPPGRADA